MSFRPARVSRSNHLERGGGANYKFNTKDYFIYIGNNNRKDQKEPEPEDINIKLNKGDREGGGGRRKRGTGRDRQTYRQICLGNLQELHTYMRIQEQNVHS